MDNPTMITRIGNVVSKYLVDNRNDLQGRGAQGRDPHGLA